MDTPSPYNSSISFSFIFDPAWFGQVDSGILIATSVTSIAFLQFPDESRKRDVVHKISETKQISVGTPHNVTV